MKTQCLSLDRISTLPDNIIETILTLMPIRDALRTSVLSKKWRCSWQSMPKLVFKDDMLKVTPSRKGRKELRKYKLVNAIFHVLLLHNGPTILEFRLSFLELEMVSEFDQIITHLSKRNTVKELTFMIGGRIYNLPVSFFSMQGLEIMNLKHCGFEPPLAFNGFSRLRSMVFMNVKVSTKMLQGFFSNCPLLDHVILGGGNGYGLDVATGGNTFTFGELFQCVPLIKTLGISKCYMKCLSAGGMPHKLPTSLPHLKILWMSVCLMEPNEISSILCLIRSSPLLVNICLTMFDSKMLPIDQQTPNNLLDLEHYSDMKLDHLEKLEIKAFSNLPLEMEFVKLIMAKSPVLKKVQLWLDDKVSVDEELKLLRVWFHLPFLRASPSAKLTIERPKLNKVRVI